MATLDQAVQKWKVKTVAAIPKWREAVRSEETLRAWKRGIETFIGEPPSEDVARLYYQDVTSDAAAEKYRVKVTSDAAVEKYKRNVKRGLTAKLSL